MDPHDPPWQSHLRGARRPVQPSQIAGSVAWACLVVTTVVSWWQHPLRPADGNLFAAPFGQLYGVHLAALFGFFFLARRRDVPQGLAAPIMFALGLAFVLAHDRFGSNELAGILLLFIPWTLAVALADPDAPDPESTTIPHTGLITPEAQRWAAGLAAVLFLGMLYNTSSRSGLGAILIVMLCVLWGLGRRGRGVLIGGALLGGAWLLRGGWDRWLEFFIFDGKSQRLTFYTFLTGRPHIWERHLQAVQDMPFTGVGLGASEVVVKGLYPLSRFEPIVVVEDAHNFLLHVACELGLPALLALLGLLIVAGNRLWRRWRATVRRPYRGLQRAWILGIGGGLAAYWLYGLVDVVAFGRIGSLPFWGLLGLACQQPRESPVAAPVAAGPSRPTAAATTGHRRWIPAGVLLVAGLGIGIWTGLDGRHRLNFNVAVLHTAEALLTPTPPEAARLAMEAQTDSTCRAHYFIGRLAAHQNLDGPRDAAYRALFQCTDAFDDLVAHLLPNHAPLAEEALRRHPAGAAAHLWRARQLARGDADDRSTARDLFRRALHLDASNGRAWIELGNLLYHHNRREALIAYAEACERGDYYGQGCWQAGATARDLGDLEAAIGYYRSSRMPGSQSFAQGLEAQRRRQLDGRPESDGPEPPTAPRDDEP